MRSLDEQQILAHLHSLAFSERWEAMVRLFEKKVCIKCRREKYNVRIVVGLRMGHKGGSTTQKYR